ncbi:MAG: AMP-binding protein [Pirellulales bacterium]
MQNATILASLASHCEKKGDSTAYTFLNSDLSPLSITYRDLDDRARCIATNLLDIAESGDRAIMMYPPGLDFIEAFLGCLYAGIVPVPAYPPKKNRNVARILAIAEDCDPKLLLCTSETRKDIEGEFANSIAGSSILVTDDVNGSTSRSLPEITSSQLALLQYTSGSTAIPKGVMITHRNIVSNEKLIQKNFEFTSDSVMVSWLPMFHDMGLIGGILSPLFAGFPAVLMAPNTFLREPLKWLQAITKYRGTCTGSPNFGYSFCAKNITEAEKRNLDLSSLRIAYNGAEPVRAQTLERFSNAFAECGFRKEAFFPCYGMAETTLFVSGGPPLTQTNVATVDVSALARHRIQLHENGQSIVSCGQIGPDLEVRIVDPETCTECEHDKVGEIWLWGNSISQGYWNRVDETKKSFQACLDGDERAWFRTGDYGFVRDGQLYVTGRLKDLIIIRGRNLYPHDVEQVVEQYLEFVEPNSCAAFSIERHGEEKLIVVAEGTKDMVCWAKPGSPLNGEAETLREKIDVLRAAILERFDVALAGVSFVRPKTFQRTSSGKVQRFLAKQTYESQSRSEFTEEPSPVPNVMSYSFLSDESQENEQQRSADHNIDAINSARQLIRSIVLEWLQSEVDPEARSIEDDRQFGTLGIDSVAAVSLTGALEKAFGCDLPESLFFQNQSINEIVKYLQNEVGLTGGLDVRLATTEEELEAVYSFRYTVYVDEMNRVQTYADHEMRRIVDPLDANGDVFAVWQDGSVVGTVRVNLLRRDPLDDYRKLYCIDHLAEKQLNQSSISTRIMLAPHVRRSAVGPMLLLAAYEHGRKHGVKFDYCDCNDSVLEFFEQIGYRAIRRVQHPEYGDVSVMRLDLEDTTYLQSIGSPLVVRQRSSV